MLYQQFAQSLQGGNDSAPAPVLDSSSISGRNHYGYEIRYYQNIQAPVYYATEGPRISPITPAPTNAPFTVVNTPNPTAQPTVRPTAQPSFGPTEEPTFSPTEEPTFSPTEEPTFSPTEEPTFSPTTITNSNNPTTAGPTFTPNTAILTYQQVVGFCNGPDNGIGCANENPGDPPAGNPNDIVNCYDATIFGVEVPFSLDAVRVWIGDSTVLAPDLQVNVWVGFAGGGPPIASRLLYSEEQFGYAVGENTFELSMGRLIDQPNFCVGVTSRSTNAGLRVMFDTTGLGEASYLRSPECGLTEFTSLFDAGLENDFCIEAFVSYGDALL